MDANMNARLDRLEAQGFDTSYAIDHERIKVKCSQCAALVLNGTACHETGCPNARKECAGCNELVPMRVKYCAECAS